jgi:ABC-type histidine transport system ATPase subunit
MTLDTDAIASRQVALKELYISGDQKFQSWLAKLLILNDLRMLLIDESESSPFQEQVNEALKIQEELTTLSPEYDWAGMAVLGAMLQLGQLDP